jgi:NADH-quinone oxidoreductase subunit C
MAGQDIMDETLLDLGEHITGELSGQGVAYSIDHGELNVTVDAEHIISVLRFLRDDPSCRFVCFIDISGVDYPAREKRFDVVYHLLSPYQNTRIRVKVMTDEDTPVPSAVDVFPAANWFEREAFDLYGILFSGHPDLRRILTDYGFAGHPLAQGLSRHRPR